jgi:serine/threonine protein kinase
MSQETREFVEDLLARAEGGDPEVESLRDHTLVRELGEGGMGAVCLLTHAPTGRPVALKIMRPVPKPSEKARALFLREMRILGALRHPNVVRYLDAGSSRDILFISMEFCDGGSVLDRMEAAGGRLPLREAVEIVLQALDGLEYGHHAPVPSLLADGGTVVAEGIVHRDLKPGNLFLSGPEDTRVVKIGDFGLSKAYQTAGLSGMTPESSPGYTPCGGTPPFQPRHQVIDYKYAGPEVDVWAMAASLYNILTGQYPRNFGRGEWYDVITNTDPTPIRHRDPSIPAPLADLLDQALDDRSDKLAFPSAAEFKRALETAMKRC